MTFPNDPLADGDPDAPDPNGAYEPILEEDPAPAKNPDFADDFSDLEEGDDSEEDLDDDQEEEEVPTPQEMGILHPAAPVEETAEEAPQPAPIPEAGTDA